MDDGSRFTDEEVLREAFADVVPLEPGERERVTPRPRAASTGVHYDEDAEILEELDALVAGEAPFDSFPHSDEHVQWASEDCVHGVLERLADGEIPFQAHIDLHGRTRAEARIELERFLKESQARNLTCVLVVHGRGKGSPDGKPVLRTAIHSWMKRGAIGRLVLAFSTALGVDGGSGATYVLLA